MGDYTRIKLNMFDDYWLDYRRGTLRRWYTPQLASIYQDKNYEANIYSSMYYIPELSKYRMWYEVSPDLRNDAFRYMALAQSDDGLHFEPFIAHPDVEPRMRNIVMVHGGVHGASVLYDPADENPKRRYKFFGMTYANRHNSGQQLPVVVEYSADGINFTDDGTRVVHPFTSDAFNSAFYNPYDKTYNVILRGAYVDRRIAISRSSDLETWSKPEILIAPSPLDNDNMLQTQHYSMWVGFVDGIFYGLLWRFYSDITNSGLSKSVGFMECELLYSYDGRVFMHTTGKPVIERPAPPQFGCMQQDMMGIMTTKDKKQHILYGVGMKMVHGSAALNAEYSKRFNGECSANVFYTIRKDGFCGIEGLFGNAYVSTKPILFNNGDIEFNINAAVGLARVRFTDYMGKPIDGFDYDDCIPLENDDTAWRPSYGGHDINELVGKRVRIDISLSSAVLHAITMDAQPFIDGPQKSFADCLQLY